LCGRHRRRVDHLTEIPTIPSQGCHPIKIWWTSALRICQKRRMQGLVRPLQQTTLFGIAGVRPSEVHVKRQEYPPILGISAPVPSADFEVSLFATCAF
jgi:hypothetical protein